MTTADPDSDAPPLPGGKTYGMCPRCGHDIDNHANSIEVGHPPCLTCIRLRRSTLGGIALRRTDTLAVRHNMVVGG